VFWLPSLVWLRADAAEVITSIRALRELPPNRLNQQLPVRVEGVVIGVIERTGRLQIQDDGLGVVVAPESPESEPPPLGARVLVEGETVRNAIVHVHARKVTLVSPDHGMPAARVMSIPEARGDETILVMEDDPTVRQTIRRALEHYGYTVLLAEDGPSAEALWGEVASRVDLVLTDMVMPDGVSGFELVERMRKIRADQRVIHMTGHSREVIEHGNRLTAGYDFLLKPFENRSLLRMIRERLDGPERS